MPALVLGCAQSGSISGGAKDETPPQAVLINPPMYTTNFSGNSVDIEFDEYITVNDLSGQLLVSPLLNGQPEAKIRGKKLRLTWEDSLKANTTYQFNFGKSVVDLNESNPNTDLRYVISTGSYVDSLAIYGKVLSALDNEPVSQASVMIYSGSADSLPRTTTPSYFALTNDQGEFRLNYLPEGDFKLFILADGNGNYLYDGPPEAIGFVEERLLSMPIDSQRPLVVPLFIEADTNQYIKSAKGTDYGYYEAIFNIPASNPSIRFLDPQNRNELEALHLINERSDTLKSWVRFPERRNFEEVEVLISADSLAQDTSFWYIETDPRYAEKATLKLSSNTNLNKLDLGGSFDILISQPVAEADTSLIYILEDSTRVYAQKVEKGALFMQLRIQYPFSKDKNYSIISMPGAFEDVFGNYSDSTNFQFSLQEAEYYGAFSVKITLEQPLKSGAAILQLSQKGSLRKEMRFTESQTISFGRLPPGSYEIIVVFDENDNGKWDTGSYDDRRQPEKLSIYPEPIEIRSNWDLDIDWTPLGAYPDQ